MTKEQLLEYFTYDRENGQLIWKSHPALNAKKFLGKVAGSINADGYRQVKIHGEYYAISKLIWLIETGELTTTVYHKNTIPYDDRISNLQGYKDRTHAKGFT